jgi:hypothetical protein
MRNHAYLLPSDPDLRRSTRGDPNQHLNNEIMSEKMGKKQKREVRSYRTDAHRKGRV